MALLASAAAGSSNGSSVTTGAIDTTGATVFIIAIGQATGAPGTPTDSEGNTWTELRRQAVSSNQLVLWISMSPVTDASHTFSVTAGFPSIAIAAFDGTFLTDVDDFGNSAEAGVSVLSSGTIYTPAAQPGVILAAIGWNSSATMAIDSGFTIAAQANWGAGTNYGVGLAYKIGSFSDPEEPEWSWAGTSVSAAAAMDVVLEPAAASVGGAVSVLSGAFFDPIIPTGYQ